MWNWFRDRRRKKILATPFPGEWERIIQKHLPCYQHFNNVEKKRLQNLVQVFIADKHWVGCNGLPLTDKIRVVIAAQACLLILALPGDYYRRVKSIYIYPSTVLVPERKKGFFEVSTTPTQGPIPISGQAHYRGPVILVWDDVKEEARDPEQGHNVVYHEFAHKLDMLDGKADGTPPLTSREEYQRWMDICSREFLELSDRIDRGQSTFIDSYGATNEAEFFAVATEHFFNQPEQFKQYHPELYQVLQGFYRQDPAQRVLDSRLS